MARPVFLAAPDRGDAALALIDHLAVKLEVLTQGRVRGGTIWTAHMQLGDAGVEVDADTYFERTLTALQEASVVVAVLDGPQVDDQVAVLLGYAFAAGKLVVGFMTDRREKPPLVEGTVTRWAHSTRELAAALTELLPAEKEPSRSGSGGKGHE